MSITEGFQAPFAEKIKASTGIDTMAVGFLWNANSCENIIASGQADMVALARKLLDDPKWPLHAAAHLGQNEAYHLWPIESGWWLSKRDRLVQKLGLRNK